MRMKTPSIRRTLLIRCGLGIGALLCLLSVGIYLLVEGSLYGEIDDSIKDTAAILSNQVELEDGHINYEWAEGQGTNSALVEDGLFQFWNEKQGTSTSSPALHGQMLPRFRGADGAPVLRKIVLADGRHARAVGLRIYPFVLPKEQEAMQARGEVIDPRSLPQTLVVAREVEAVHRSLQRLRWILAAGCVLTLGLGFLLIELAVRSSLKPIQQLAKQVQDRAEHQLDKGLDLPEELPVELRGLAEHFNLLLGRVAAIRERERDFVRHAAHELRTPIAGLRATADVALAHPRDAAAYAEYLGSCQKSAMELGELVKRLSALARIGRETQAVALEKIELSALLRESWVPFQAAAEARGLKADFAGSSTAMTALADPALLKIVLNNLFDNAVCYAIPSSTIRVAMEKQASGIEIRVANRTDQAPIDPERLFEPLFRRNASRDDADSHLGIGLTLSLEAARAMGGSLRGEYGDGEIRFALLLPEAQA